MIRMYSLIGVDADLVDPRFGPSLLSMFLELQYQRRHIKGCSLFSSKLKVVVRFKHFLFTTNSYSHDMHVRARQVASLTFCDVKIRLHWKYVDVPKVRVCA